MRTHYWSDNGPPCWHCDGSCYRYTVDDKVGFVAAICASCGGDNMFLPSSQLTHESTAAQVSAAHRKAAGAVWAMEQERDSYLPAYRSAARGVVES